MKRYPNSFFRLFELVVVFLIICFFSYVHLRGAAIETTKDAGFTKGSRALKIPFVISDEGHIFLRVRVNNSEPILFGLDSGFEQTAMSAKQAKALNLKLYGDAKVTGGGENEEDISFAKNISFDLPGVSFKLKEIGVLALDFPSPVAGEAIGDILPIRMLDNYPSIPATVSLPGLAPVTGMFVIDTGASGDIFFYSPFVRQHKLLDSKQETTEAATLGIGGTSQIRIGFATNIRLGRTVIANPVVHFSLATKGDSATTFSAGHLGNNLFRQFKVVIFDATRRRLILGPRIQTR